MGAPSVLLSLPSDLLRVIFRFVVPWSLVALRFTCRRFRALVPPPLEARGAGFCQLAAGAGDLELLQWGRQVQRAPWDDLVCFEAALHGQLAVLRWASAHGAPRNAWIMAAAAEGGHLAVLQWAHENGAPVNANVCLWAARKGNLEALQWARANNAAWNEAVCELAAAGGHLQLLQWARANGAPWNEHVCTAAAREDRLEVLQWARSAGCPWNEERVRFVAGDRVAHWLRSLGGLAEATSA